MTLQPPQPRSTVVSAAGTAQIDMQHQGTAIRRYYQVSVSMPSAPGNATCGVYFNGNLVSPLVPQADAASGDPPVAASSLDTVSVIWANCTPGQIGTATFIYDDGM